MSRRNPSQGSAKAVDAEHGERLKVTSTANDNGSPPYSTYGSGPSATTTIAGRNSKLRASPESARRSSSGFLIPVPEEGGNMAFDHQLHSFPQSVVLDVEEDDDDDEEVEEWLLEQELAREGLYRGSYKRLVAMYTFTPIATILAFTLLALFPLIIYPLDPHLPYSPYPYAPYLPYPVPELSTAAALWSMALLLREFVFSVSSSLSSTLPPYASVILSLLATVSQTLVSVLLQLLAVALLFISPTPGINHPTWHDHAFRRIWTVALGWAGAEAIVGIKQGYENIALYRDVLVSVKKINPDDASRSMGRTSSSDVSPALTRASTLGSQELLLDAENHHRLDSTMRGERQPLLPPKPQQANGLYRFSKASIEQEVQNDLDQLLAIKSREELEEIYGIPVIQIPVFISCLHRVNAVLNSLGTFLLLSAAYLRSPLAPSVPDRIPTLSPGNHILAIVEEALTKYSHTLLGVTVFAVVVCQLTLALLHTAWILPRIGVPTYVYIGTLSSLTLFFAGLALWEALV